MRSSGWTPSIVPNGNDQTVYLVKDDLGCFGAVWREADAEATDHETVITDLLTGQYKDPVRVIAFNTAEGWSRDVNLAKRYQSLALAEINLVLHPRESARAHGSARAAAGESAGNGGASPRIHIDPRGE